MMRSYPIVCLMAAVHGVAGQVTMCGTVYTIADTRIQHSGCTGTIPDLSSLTALTEIIVARNALSGTIPDLNALTSLTTLDLRGNQLTGTIPDWSALTLLEEINLSSNQLTGTIPDWSSLTVLEEVLLHANQLTGTIPALNSPVLNELYLDRNRLTGTIPDLSLLTALETLDVSSNQLTGTIPDLSALTLLEEIYFNNNRLTGTIPDLSALTVLDYLYLDANDWECPVPDYSAWADDTDFSTAASCLTSGVSFASSVLPNSALVADQHACKEQCTNSELCAGWTYWPHSSWCNQYTDSSLTQPAAHSTASSVSSSNSCRATRNRRFDFSDPGNVLLSDTTENDADACCDACLAHSSCAAFHFKVKKEKCVLLSQASGATVATNSLAVMATVTV